MGKRKTETEGETTVRMSAEDFVTGWQKCETTADAKERLGKSALSRAARMVKLGVKLKALTPMRGGQKTDVKALNALIKSSAA